MAVIKQTGSNPYEGKVMTSQGYKERRAPECTKCRKRRTGTLYTVDPNGQVVCAFCAGNIGVGVLADDEDSPFDVAPDTES